MEKETKITNWEHDIWYATKLFQRLRK